MKKIFVLLLVLTLGLSLVACGNSAEVQVADFHPETPEEFIETVLEDLNGQYSYHRRSEAYPDKPEREGIVDVFFEEIGTAEQTVSGTVTDKKSKGSWTVYGKGNLLAKCGATSNKVIYRDFEGTTTFSLYEPYPSSNTLCVLRGKLEENFLDGTVREYLTDEATLTEEDGAYTLTVPLGTEALYQLGEFSSRGDAHEYISPSDVIYKADKTGALTSLEMVRESNGKPFRVLRMDFSYTPVENKKPAWFNEENPLESEGGNATLIHDLGNEQSIFLTNDDGRLTAEVYSDYAFVTIPSFLPTDIYYKRVTSTRGVIFEQWSPETELDEWFVNHTTIFYQKGTRPEGNTQKNTYFEGEWEIKNGEPTKIVKPH